MFRDEKLELRVGLFIGAGIFLMFLFVFSIKDISMLGKGYSFNVIFDYVNGVTKDSPVRLAGVDVGEVKKITLYFDEEVGRTRVKLDVRVRSNVKIREDAVARINTLGLLGEQYLEISPGMAEAFITPGTTIIGRNPFNVGQQMEKMNELFITLKDVFEHIAEGKGSLGKFIMEDTIYEDLKVIFGRLRDGEGTVGKLLVEEKIYDDLEDFVADIKANPWKLLSKPRRSRKKTSDKKRGTAI